MKPFVSLLLTLDGSAEAAKGLGAAVWLAGRLHATLHVLYATAEPQPAREALERLHVPEEHRPALVLHQATGAAESAVLDAIAAHGVQLVVMSARGAGAGNQRRTGRVAQAILERSPVPVLLVPRHYREAVPWQAMLVAASGEAAADQALEVAAPLAEALGLRVTVAHCAGASDPGAPAPLGRYADAPHHEVPRRLHEMVHRAVPPQACACVAEVVLCRGEPGEELLSLLEKRETSLLVLGWHGGFGPGRAPVLKHVLDRATCPVLIVKEAPKPRARLVLAGEAAP